MFQVQIIKEAEKYNDDKKIMYCPGCSTKHSYITYQDKKCQSCDRALPDVAILMGDNERQAKKFFEELEKCGK